MHKTNQFESFVLNDAIINSKTKAYYRPLGQSNITDGMMVHMAT